MFNIIVLDADDEYVTETVADSDQELLEILEHYLEDGCTLKISKA